MVEKDYRNINSVVVQLFFPEPTEAPSTGTLEAKVIDKREIERKKEKKKFQEGYNSIMEKYGATILDRTAVDGKRIGYKNIWTYIPQEAGLKVKVLYRVLVSKYRGLSKTWEDREEEKEISPKSLEELAELRREDDLKGGDFYSTQNVGKYAALIDLSLKALQNPKITVEEGEFLVKYLHLSLYVTKENITQDIYDRFKGVLFYIRRPGFLKCPKSTKERISAAFREVWRKYPMGVEVATSTRSSKDVEKELVRRKLEGDKRRGEKEMPEVS